MPRLRAAGPLAALLAAFDGAGELEALDRATCSDLPPDFINHLVGQLSCAVTLGWGHDSADHYAS